MIDVVMVKNWCWVLFFGWLLFCVDFVVFIDILFIYIFLGLDIYDVKYKFILVLLCLCCGIIWFVMKVI